MSQKIVKKATVGSQSAKRNAKKSTSKAQSAESKAQSAESKVQSVESRIEHHLAELSSLNSELCALNSVLCRSNEQHADGTPASIPPPNPVMAALITAITAVENGLTQFSTAIGTDEFLTGRERKRLIGVRSRNYGFINKSFEIAYDHPDFVPPLFDLNGMATTVGILAKSRMLTELLGRFYRLVDDLHLTTCDVAFRDALRIYGNLRELNRGRVPGADVLFQQLRQYFTLRRRRPDEEESTPPTQHQLELDFERLTHGKADGEMTVKHVSPHVTGGLHEVVDDVRPRRSRGSAEIKVQSEE